MKVKVNPLTSQNIAKYPTRLMNKATQFFGPKQTSWLFFAKLISVNSLRRQDCGNNCKSDWLIADAKLDKKVSLSSYSSVKSCCQPPIVILGSVERKAKKKWAATVFDIFYIYLPHTSSFFLPSDLCKQFADATHVIVHSSISPNLLTWRRVTDNMQTFLFFLLREGSILIL